MNQPYTPSESANNQATTTEQKPVKQRTTRKEKLLAKRAELMDKRAQEIKALNDQVKAIEKEEKKKAERKHLKAYQTLGKLIADNWDSQKWKDLKTSSQKALDSKKITAAQHAAIIELIESKLN